MKKIFALLMICALVLMTGCGGQQESKPADKPAENSELRLGMIAHLNATENKLGEIYNKLVTNAGVHLAKYTPKFYNSLNQMTMDAEAGNVDQLSIYSCVANYLIAGNGNFEIVSDFKPVNLSDSFCFAVRKDDTALKADLDKTIDAMQSDGTLDKLIKEYITDVKPDSVPKVEIPHFDGAETLKVGVTGDLPPLDLVLADNSPAGFNTALLAETSKRLNRNIEVVQIDSGARAAALSSGQIDVIFWAVVPNNTEMPADIDKPDGVEFSVPYFKDDVAHLKLKK